MHDQQDDSLKIVIVGVIIILLVLLVFSTKVAGIIGADVGVTFEAILKTILVVVPIVLLLKYKFNTGPLGLFVAFTTFGLPLWWGVMDNVAGKLPEPSWWDSYWFKYGVEGALLVVIFFLIVRQR